MRIDFNLPNLVQHFALLFYLFFVLITLFIANRMSVEHCLQAIVAKLDQLSQGLENLEKKIGGGSVSSTPSSSVGPSEDSPSVTEFVGLVNEFITKVLSTSKAIDGSVSEAVCNQWIRGKRLS